MATPITNNTTALISNTTTKPTVQEPGARPGQAALDVVATDGQEQGVSVSRAAQLLSQQPAERGVGVIQSADQAMQLAKGLRALFAANSGQALAAQAGNVPADLMGLLQAG